MKVRNGFVSNSSSSSFLILSKNNPVVPEERLKWPEFVTAKVINENYNRNRNEVVETVEDKVKLVTALYAIACSWEDDNLNEEVYIAKMIAFKKKVCTLGKKYNYAIHIKLPPIFFSEAPEYDDEGKDTGRKYIHKFIDVMTEWWGGVDYIKPVVEDEDTSTLERLLFNPESKFIIGGDEYYISSVLAYQERQKIEANPYEYEVIGTGDGWGLDRIPYYVHGTVPEFDSYANDEEWNEESWSGHYSQPNLPFDYELKEKNYED